MKSRMSVDCCGVQKPGSRAKQIAAQETGAARFVTLSDAGSDAKQDALWAQLMAERPDMLSNVVSFILGARRRIVDPPSRRAKARSDDA